MFRRMPRRSLVAYGVFAKQLRQRSVLFTDFTLYWGNFIKNLKPKLFAGIM